ncbi:MAG TPA: hypothetical protein VGB51_08730 [Actinomycetota bacterium]
MTLRLRTALALLAAIATSTSVLAPAGASHNDDDHSDNMALLGSVVLNGATDVEFTKDDYAVVTVNGSGEFAGLWTIDISDPRNPRAEGHLPCAGSGYDVGLWKNIAVMSSDSPSANSSTEDVGCNLKGTSNQEGIRLVDITDRSNPKELSFVVTDCGSHTNVTFSRRINRKRHGFVYVQSYTASTSGTCASAHQKISVVDITKPRKAEVVATPSVAPANGCHDGTVKGRYAYMACLSEGQVWDISDPLAPEILSHITDVPDAIWHSTAISNDGKTAAFGFESFQGGTSSCNGTGLGIEGAIWFYDVSDPAAPVQRGHFVPPRVVQGVCTAHNFDVVTGRDVIVTAWYNAGVMAIDFSDPAAPAELAHYLPSGTNTWDAKWHDGYVYVGDSGRGLDVYEIEGL